MDSIGQNTTQDLTDPLTTPTDPSIFPSHERSWADVDSDEQDFLELLQTYGEGFFDMASILFSFSDPTPEALS